MCDIVYRMRLIYYCLTCNAYSVYLNGKSGVIEILGSIPTYHQLSIHTHT